MQSVQVYVHDSSSGNDVRVGSAREALHDGRLRGADRAAVRHVVAAVDYLGARFGYHELDDPSRGVELVLHATRGPAEGFGQILVPATNVFAGVPDIVANEHVVLPADAARHELVHLLQERITGQPIGSHPTSREAAMGVPGDLQGRSVAEGLADALSELQVRRWTTGEGFLDQHRSAKRVARDYDDPSSRRAIQHVRSDFMSVLRTPPPTVPADPHVEGGVLPTIARSIQQQVGWAAAEDVFWGALNDDGFASGAMGWSDIAAALARQAEHYDTVDPAVANAVRGALHTTNLDSVLATEPS